MNDRRTIDLAEYERLLDEHRIAARKRRRCDCTPPKHLHGSQPTCPRMPPPQEHCSPSLAFIGECHCPRHRDEFTDA